MFKRLMLDDTSQKQSQVQRLTRDNKEITVSMTASVLANNSGEVLSVITCEKLISSALLPSVVLASITF